MRAVRKAVPSEDVSSKKGPEVWRESRGARERRRPHRPQQGGVCGRARSRAAEAREPRRTAPAWDWLYLRMGGGAFESLMLSILSWAVSHMQEKYCGSRGVIPQPQRCHLATLFHQPSPFSFMFSWTGQHIISLLNSSVCVLNHTVKSFCFF